MKKILIEVPTWLGDCVMSTSAIENIVNIYPNVKITIMGSLVSTTIFVTHPNVEKIIIDKSRNANVRLWWLYSMAKNLGEFDFAISFRRTIASKILIFFMKANRKAIYTRLTKKVVHQVVRYNDFINKTLNLKTKAGALKVYFEPLSYEKPTLGINPGASYGSAKRWYPEKFAAVAVALSDVYDIVIFGGPSEVDMAGDIEEILKEKKIDNYKNIAGKTSIVELCQQIGGLDLFITGDSGPMHVATAFRVPTVALFGPTNDAETSAWQNTKSIIVKKDMACAPCMKRTCPLKHHECMKHIEVDDVLRAVKKLELT